MNRHSVDNGKTTVAGGSDRLTRFGFSIPNGSASRSSRKPVGLLLPQYVRFATLSAVADNGTSLAPLAPIIERTFRGTYVLASKMRYEMLEAGQNQKLDALVADARKVQQKLQDRASE